MSKVFVPLVGLKGVSEMKEGKTMTIVARYATEAEYASDILTKVAAVCVFGVLFSPLLQDVCVHSNVILETISTVAIVVTTVIFGMASLIWNSVSGLVVLISGNDHPFITLMLIAVLIGSFG